MPRQCKKNKLRVQRGRPMIPLKRLCDVCEQTQQYSIFNSTTHTHIYQFKTGSNRRGGARHIAHSHTLLCVCTSVCTYGRGVLHIAPCDGHSLWNSEAVDRASLWPASSRFLVSTKVHMGLLSFSSASTNVTNCTRRSKHSERSCEDCSLQHVYKEHGAIE